MALSAIYVNPGLADAGLFGQAFRRIAEGTSPVVVARPRNNATGPKLEVIFANGDACTLLDLDGAYPVVEQTAARRPSDPPAVLHWTAAVTHFLQRLPDASQWQTVRAMSPIGLPLTLQLRIEAIDDGLVLIWFRDAAKTDEQIGAEAEQRFRLLAQCSSVGILATDRGARATFVNNAFATMVSTSMRTLLGTGWLRLVHADHMQALLSDIEQTLRGYRTSSNVSLSCGSGAHRNFHLQLMPVSCGGRSAGIVATLQPADRLYSLTGNESDDW